MKKSKKCITCGQLAKARYESQPVCKVCFTLAKKFPGRFEWLKVEWEFVNTNPVTDESWEEIHAKARTY